MNKAIKYLVGATVVAPFLMAGVASAASIPASTVFDGQTNAYGNAGTGVTATFRVNVAAGEVVHAIRTKVDSQATVCLEIGPFEGAQNVDVPVTITLPPNSNNSGYNLTAELYTTATIPQAEAMTGNLACTGTHSLEYTGTNVIHVFPVSGNTSTGNSQTQAQQIADLMALVNQLIAAQHATSTPAPNPTPAPTGNAAKCALIAPFLGATPYDYSSLGIQLQSALLLDNPYSIPALQAGSTVKQGYFGPQTHTALANYNTLYGCH